MEDSWKRTSVVTGLAMACLVLLAPQIDAHEKGVLKLTTRQLVPGDSVGITGQHFSRRAILKIELVGIAGRTRLVEVRADTLGAFRRALIVPASLPSGSYRVVAIAADGDEVASVDVSVVVRASSQMPSQAHEESAPTARPLTLTRARSPFVTGGALVFLALTLIGGATLLRRPRTVQSPRHTGGTV